MSFKTGKNDYVVNNKDGSVIEIEKTEPKKPEAVAEEAKIIKKVTKDTSDKAQPAVDKPQIARTIPDLTNIRKAADPNSEVVMTVAKGAEFNVVKSKSTSGYVAISVQGDTAFIKKELVEVFVNPAYNANTFAGKIG